MKVQDTATVVAREVRRIRAQGRKFLMRFSLSREWEERTPGIAGRTYDSYDSYKAHQALKLDAHRAKSIERHDARFYSALKERIPGEPVNIAGARVLCLAARQGSEVRAFIDSGAFAVGIDLNPGRENKYVMSGDFHDLQFHDHTIDIVYTNSLDHAFDLDRIMSEVKRVLVNGGVLICEVRTGEVGGGRGFYESLSWESVEDLITRIASSGFLLARRTSFDLPWTGDQLLFRSA